MKVLLVNSVCGVGSTGRIAVDIAEAFIREGHVARVAYGRGQVPEKYKDISYKIGNDFRICCNALKARLLDNEGFNARKETKKFIKWANEYNPDVVWLHNLHGYYINVELLFNWIKRRPQMEVKWTLHDCWAFTGHCSHFSYIGCNKWIRQCGGCPQLKDYPKCVMIDNSKYNFNRKKSLFTNVKGMKIITPSKWLKDLVKQSFLSEYNVEVKHNTIDTNVFKPTESSFKEEYRLENKKIVLGVSAIWSKRKGLYDFIKLANLLEEPYQVVLVGISNDELGENGKRIICIPRTDSMIELAKIYTAADVFLNLTYEDNYPTVNLEAQACNTPCITYRTGGSIESVLRENVVEQGDLKGVLLAIERIIGN